MSTSNSISRVGRFDLSTVSLNGLSLLPNNNLTCLSDESKLKVFHVTLSLDQSSCSLSLPSTSHSKFPLTFVVIPAVEGTRIATRYGLSGVIHVRSPCLTGENFYCNWPNLVVAPLLWLDRMGQCVRFHQNRNTLSWTKWDRGCPGWNCAPTLYGTFVAHRTISLLSQFGSFRLEIAEGENVWFLIAEITLGIPLFLVVRTHSSWIILFITLILVSVITGIVITRITIVRDVWSLSMRCERSSWSSIRRSSSSSAACSSTLRWKPLGSWTDGVYSTVLEVVLFISSFLIFFPLFFRQDRLRQHRLHFSPPLESSVTLL